MSNFFRLIPLILILLPLVSSHYFEESKYRLEKVSNELESVSFKLNEGCYDNRNEVERENSNQNQNGQGNHHSHLRHSRLCRNSAYSSTMQLFREISYVTILLENWRNHSACLNYEEEPRLENLIMSFTQGALEYMGKLNESQHLNHLQHEKRDSSTNISKIIIISSSSSSVETVDKNRRTELRRLKSEYERYPYSTSQVLYLLANEHSIQKIGEKVRFCEAVESNGGIFIGYDQPREEEHVMEVVRGRRNRGTIAYVLFLKDYSLVDEGLCNRDWKENRDVWFHELKSRRLPAPAPSSKLVELPPAEFYAIDCSFKMDLCNDSLVLPVIHQYENGKLLQKNYAGYHRNQIKKIIPKHPQLSWFGEAPSAKGQGATAQARISQDGVNSSGNESGRLALKKENGVIFLPIFFFISYFNSIL